MITDTNILLRNKLSESKKKNLEFWPKILFETHHNSQVIL